MSIELWEKAYRALQDLHQWEGGNAVVRVLSRFFSELSDKRFQFTKVRRAFILFAVEDTWYKDLIQCLDDLTQGGRISLDQAQALVDFLDKNQDHAEPIHKVLNILGISITPGLDLPDDATEAS